MITNRGSRGMPFRPELLATLAFFSAFLAATDLSAADPPSSQTYFTVLLGLGASYEWEADCLKFTGNSVCTEGGLCGSWQATDSTSFELSISADESGVSMEINAQGRVEDRGDGSTIGGTGVVTIEGAPANFGFTGRALKAKKCRAMLETWDVSKPPQQASQNPECLARAKFKKPKKSKYILPFPVGTAYNVSQTYCFADSTHRNELAYDFDIPLGADIVAARGGTVFMVSDHRPDDSPWPDANYLKIQHNDGTIAAYIHLQQDSVSAREGDRVEAGEVIARSSMSGTILPHLHFVVFKNEPPVEGNDVPVNFRNAQGPLDDRNGLIQGVVYQALPH